MGVLLVAVFAFTCAPAGAGELDGYSKCQAVARHPGGYLKEGVNIRAINMSCARARKIVWLFLNDRGSPQKGSFGDVTRIRGLRCSSGEEFVRCNGTRGRRIHFGTRTSL